MNLEVLRDAKHPSGIVRKIGIYARSANAGSIEEQIEACKKVVSDLDNAVVKVYSDVNSSGVHWNRSALKSLIKDVKSGLIDKVVITDVSRVSRSMKDFISFHRILSDNNVVLDTVDGSFGKDASYDALIVRIMECLHEYEMNVGGGYNG